MFKKNKEHLHKGLYRSTDPKYIEDDIKSVNVPLRFTIWFILTLIIEGLIWYAGMHYSILDPSWKIDGYITTAVSIGSWATPIALGILEFMW